MKIFYLTAKRFYVLSICLFALVASQEAKADFASGADIGWLSQMEASGYVFYNDSGVQENCMQILKEHGINSLRFRVWVNPTGGWCGKKDVATMVHRADSMGFRVMIDFHYSDTWADPGSQTKPVAWENDSLSQLLTDIYNHTYTVLDTIKSLGITPEWVQVGNETNNGMLWPDGKASASMANFAAMVTSGYNAIKAIDSTIKVIVHVSNGYNSSTFKWIFDGLKSNGGKWDVIGMSLYPSTTDWSTKNAQCLSNISYMQSRYGSEVMICEVGMTYTATYACNAFLLDLIAKVKSVSGLGVFYWEPECYNWNSYLMGAWDPTTKKPTIALDAFLGISYTEPNGVKATSGSSGINLYPNPMASGLTNLQLTGLSGTTNIRILNLNGQVIKDQVSINQQNVSLDNLDLNAGVYFIQISNSKQKEVRTLVVK
jgi:arabinogalactan endo-1,4-beta-galactosidase